MPPLPLGVTSSVCTTGVVDSARASIDPWRTVMTGALRSPPTARCRSRRRRSGMPRCPVHRAKHRRHPPRAPERGPAPRSGQPPRDPRRSVRPAPHPGARVRPPPAVRPTAGMVPAAPHRPRLSSTADAPRSPASCTSRSPVPDGAMMSATGVPSRPPRHRAARVSSSCSAPSGVTPARGSSPLRIWSSSPPMPVGSRPGTRRAFRPHRPRR